MSMQVQVGFTGSGMAERLRPDLAEAFKKPADKIAADGEVIAGTDTDEVDNRPKNAFEAAIDKATGYDPDETAADDTDGETDASEDNEGQEQADDCPDGVMPTLKPEKEAPLFDPKSEYEKVIANYLKANASDALMEKIRKAKAHGYNIQTCFSYITEQARKQAKNNCAMIEDAVVYGWAVHYFEDEWQADAKKKAEAKAKADAEKAKAEAKRKADEEAKAARLAAMTPEDRELALRAEEEEAARIAAREEDAKRERAEAEAKRKAERAELKKVERNAYEAAKRGEEVPTDGLNDAQKRAVKDGVAKFKAEAAAARKAEREAKAAAKAAAEAAQGDLFAGLV